jgi:hypothetical protein
VYTISKHKGALHNARAAAAAAIFIATHIARVSAWVVCTLLLLLSSLSLSLTLVPFLRPVGVMYGVLRLMHLERREHEWR